MILRQPVRFVAVGGAGYAVNVALFASLHASEVTDVPASVIAYLTSNALMYIANRQFTFGAASISFWGGYLRYGLVGVFVATLNTATLTALVRVAGLPPIPGAALSAFAITPPAYLLVRRFAFRFTSSRRTLESAPQST